LSNTILLVDADSTIPNLALMKISTHWKSKGYSVELIKLGISYYPSRKNKKHTIETGNFHKVYCSVIFDGSINYIDGDDIIYGGTGFSLTKTLPDFVESLEPDYSIYPKCDTSYGFISRGCIRKCYFCKVPKKEGGIRQVNNIDDIVRHKKVKFMDNNFLSLPNHKDMLKELISKNVKCQFNQGLDIRLIDEENSSLLSKLNYLGEYIFAFDDIKYNKIIKSKMKFLKWRKDWQFKFFVYVHPDMPIIETMKRVRILKKNKCLPYIMRDITCWGSENSDFYTDLSSWCNQPSFFKKMGFGEFIRKRTKNKDRIRRSLELFNCEENQ